MVEDESDIARLICFHLETSGYATRWFPGSANVIDEALQARPLLFLLDIMIPGSDGLSFVGKFGEPDLSRRPHHLSTAKTGEADRIRGLELGGDDYITKPFSPRELVARCEPFCVPPTIQLLPMC